MGPSSPEISVHIKAPDFELITPEAASLMPQERVFLRGGVKIVENLADHGYEVRR
jgi:hypothetical protein